MGSRAAAERLLSAAAVLVDGQARGKSHKLAGGEEIAIEPPAPAAAERPAAVPELTVAYADEHLLVVDKPAGVVVHPAPGHAGGTLAQALAAAGAAGGEEDRPGIVHRLDRDTSGLLVVARSQETYERLQRLVRRRALTREYLALVVGRPRSRRGTIDAPIGRDRHDRAPPLARHGHAARRGDALRARGAPAGATRCCASGSRPAARTRSASTSPRSTSPSPAIPCTAIAGDLGLERQFLHAARLAFTHPVTGAAVDVSSPLPPDLAAALAAARHG